MIDDWKESHRGFQAHKKRSRRRSSSSSSSSNSNGLRSRRKIGTRSTLYWATIKYGRDCLMLAMSSCADEYDSERHLASDYGKDLASRWTSVRELRAVEPMSP